jgi:geranylgeranyl diphosphate synthase type II
MINAQLAQFLKHYGQAMEDALLAWLPLSRKPGTELFNEAVHYAVFPGGKRMRPLFTLLAAETVGGDPQKAIPIACGIEYLHTCSLIFDDLPAMDNAWERRGRQPTHKAFGEDVAILAALAFFNQCYLLVGKVQSGGNAKNTLERLLAEITVCIGPGGMIGGQFLDLRLRKTDNEQLKQVSYLKTTGLMRLMLTAGAIVAGAEDVQIKGLAAFGENLGEAYQILDDIVDEAEDHSDQPFYNHCDNFNLLWHKVSEKLEEARSRLVESLPENNPVMLLALTDKIFGMLKDQVPKRLAMGQ